MAKKFQKSGGGCLQVWQKAVPLHPLSGNNGSHEQREFFERLWINKRKCSTGTFPFALRRRREKDMETVNERRPLKKKKASWTEQIFERKRYSTMKSLILAQDER